ncbi:MAG: hypothetical protein IBJ10_06405 [Phycisphaerales bacterium]|nr:hypothetical protein [Phycisphaerales bacterium]
MAISAQSDGGTQYEEVSPELLREEIKHESPEGLPGDPELGPRRLGWVIALFAVLFVVGTAAMSVVFDPLAGVAVGALVILLCCMHPAIWGSVLRAKERGRAKRHLTGESR